jgi:hypothetical protein
MKHFVVKNTAVFFLVFRYRLTVMTCLAPRLTANAEVATVLGSIPASTDTVESEGWQMKQW